MNDWNDLECIRDLSKIAIGIIIGISLMVLGKPVCAGELLPNWHVSPNECIGAGSAAILLDTLTTYEGLRKGAVESNPLIGSHPSVGKQALVAGLKLGGNYWVCSKANEAQRKGWTGFVLLIEGGVGVANLRYVY